VVTVIASFWKYQYFKYVVIFEKNVVVDKPSFPDVNIFIHRRISIYHHSFILGGGNTGRHQYYWFSEIPILIPSTPSLPLVNIFIHRRISVYHRSFILGGENTRRHHYYWFSKIPILIPSSLSNEFTNPSKIYERK
jgi:hypothetical protein